MVNKIVNKYSKDHIIIIGDWSIGKQMRNFISTPNLTLKRKFLDVDTQTEQRSWFDIWRIHLYENFYGKKFSNTFKRCRHGFL